jgi:hypothetical protein
VHQSWGSTNKLHDSKRNRIDYEQAAPRQIYCAFFGTAIAVSVGTLSKLSSKGTGDRAFPIACERCGQPAALAVAKDERDEPNAPLAMRCAVCNHGWFILPQNPPLRLRLKPDRRAPVRDE